MSTSLFILALSSVIAAVNGATCDGFTENTSCTKWKAEGFCTNKAYTVELKKQLCCRACFCPAPPPKPAAKTGCAMMIGVNSQAVSNIFDPSTAIEPIREQFTAIGIEQVMVKKGCSLKLFTDPFTQAEGSPYVGTGEYVNVIGSAKKAIALECTCP